MEMLISANYKAVKCLSLRTLNAERCSILLQQFITTRQDKYILLENQGHVKIIIHNSATSTDILQSYVHALVLSRIVAKTTTFHVEIHIWMDKNYEGFMRKLQSLGWNTECLLCSSIVWRANWLYNSADEKSNQVNHSKLEKRRDLRKGWL